MPGYLYLIILETMPKYTQIYGKCSIENVSMQVSMPWRGSNIIILHGIQAA